MWQPLYKDDGNIRFRFVIETLSTLDDSPSSVQPAYAYGQLQTGGSHKASVSSVQ